MAKTEQEKLVELLLTYHGKTYSEEKGINLEKDKPSSLFQLLYSTLLFSARISSNIAVESRHGVNKTGLDDPRKNE